MPPCVFFFSFSLFRFFAFSLFQIWVTRSIEEIVMLENELRDIAGNDWNADGKFTVQVHLTNVVSFLFLFFCLNFIFFVLFSFLQCFFSSDFFFVFSSLFRNFCSFFFLSCSSAVSQRIFSLFLCRLVSSVV